MLVRAVGGDTRALSELLREHGSAVEQSLRIERKWQSTLDLDDVMQVTYLEAFLRIRGFDPARASSFTAWLRTIAQNNLRDAVRGLERQKQPPPDRRIQVSIGTDSYSGLYEALTQTTTTPSRLVHREEIHLALDAAIDALPRDYSAVIRMVDLGGESVSKVAKAMGRSAGAVHMLRARALDRLQEFLGSGSSFFASHT